MNGLGQHTKTQAAVDRLRRDIEQHVHAPGQWLRVQTLAASYGVSATPVREALRLLQADGLIEHIPRRGVRVAASGERGSAAADVSSLRAVLEPLAVELATERATADQIQGIRECHEVLVREVEEVGVGPRSARLNHEFHWATFAPCGSDYLLEFLRRLWTASPDSVQWPDGPATPVGEHEDLVQMMERRDARGATVVMRGHVAVCGGHRLDGLARAGGPPSARVPRSRLGSGGPPQEPSTSLEGRARAYASPGGEAAG